MRITFLLMDAYSGGGTIRTTYNTAGALARRGHDVTIVSVYRRRRKPRYAADPRVRVVALSTELPGTPMTAVEQVLRRLPSRLVPWSEARHRHFSLLTDQRLERFLRTVDTDVLVTTRPGLALAASRLAPAGLPLVGQEHLYLRAHRRLLRRRLLRAYPRLDVIATLTERDAADYRAALPSTARTRVVCIPNAAPSDRPQATGDSRVVIAAGRLHPQKGFDRLIPAFAPVARRHPGWVLRIFGSGPQRGELERLIREHALDGVVQLAPYTDHLDRELAAAAIYVMSSRVEGFPMVLLEAMATGLPVVSFDCPNGPADLITPGVDGLLVPDGDTGALAAALEQLVADPAARARMGAAARGTAATYDQDVIASRWEELFMSLTPAVPSERAR